MSHPILNTIDQIIESRKQDNAQLLSMASNMLATISNIQNALDAKKINDELAEAAVEEFMCPECKEWTDTESMCCGVGPASYNEDSLNGDR